MEVKIKIIEFSSDVFSKSTQLKDIRITPLFSNTNFSINIFEAISKNEEYKIKAHTQTIKIGLYNGKSLLGIGEINTNKKTQKIKISTEDKNKRENNFLNGAYNKLQDNDYYLTLECINIIPTNDKNKNLKRKKKNSSVDVIKNKNDLSKNIYYKYKEKTNKLNLYSKNYNLEDNYKKKKKTYDSRDNINKKKNKTITHSNYDDINDIKSNSTVIKTDNNKIKNILFSDGRSYKKNKPLNTHDNDEKDSNINIFNLSFQKELFSDGVLILSNNDETENNKKNDIFKKIDIKGFDNLINDFYLISNNVSNNNTSPMNIKNNFLLEYQFFLEKTSDIFNLYSKLSSEINDQNRNIKNYIHNYNDKIKVILKKNNILKIKKQNIEMNELIGFNKYAGSKYYYEDVLMNINTKLSLIKNMNTDFLFSIKNNRNNREKSHILLTEIFNNIINNEDNREYVKDYINIINLILYKNKKPKNRTDDEDISEYDDNYSEDRSEGNKIDLETLKNKIDKLKQQYLNETSTKDYKNKVKIREHNKRNERKRKKMNNNSNPHFKNKKKSKKVNNYLNPFTPSGEQRNRISKNDYIDNHI